MPCSDVASFCSTSTCCVLSPTLTPWTVADQIPLSMGSPGKNTGVDRRALLQGSLMSPALVLPPR